MLSNKIYVFLGMMLSFVLSVITAEAQPLGDKATALARQVIDKMGGQQAWDNTRFLAWAFNGQYQVWDKHENKFRWQKDSMVVVLDAQEANGKIYKQGEELLEPEEKQKLLAKVNELWRYNSFWLAMPFMLLAPDVSLKYLGEDKTFDGASAEKLEMICENSGLIPQSKYYLWIDQGTGLVTQWAFFESIADTEPIFIRRWSEYKEYGRIRLAADRSHPQSDFRLDYIATPTEIPASVFHHPLPIQKL